MAEDIYIIDKDEGVGHDYHTLADFEALNRDLVTDTDKATAKYRPSSGTADTTAVTIAGWTTSADYFITVTAAAGYEATMPWSGNAHYQNNSSDRGLQNSVNYTVIEKLKVEVTRDSASLGIGIENTANYCTIRYNIVRRINGTTNSSKLGINVEGATTVGCKIYRNVIYDFSGLYGCGIQVYSADSATNIVNQNTLYNCIRGIVGDGTKAVTVKQNVVGGGSGNCYENTGGWTTSKNISSDATSPDGASYRSKSSYSDYFVDYANKNFHLKSTDTVLKDAGDDLGSPYNVDFDGQTITGTWDIGADEYIGISISVADCLAPQTNIGG